MHYAELRIERTVDTFSPVPELTIVKNKSKWKTSGSQELRLDTQLYKRTRVLQLGKLQVILLRETRKKYRPLPYPQFEVGFIKTSSQHFFGTEAELQLKKFFFNKT